MSYKSNYYLWNARSGYVMLVGLILAWVVSKGTSLIVVLGVLIVSAVLSLVVYVVVDRPHVKSLS